MTNIDSHLLSREGLNIVAHCSKANLLHNIATLQSFAPGSKIMSVIKANAYGHGMLDVAEILEDRVDMFLVATLDEALTLRTHGISTAILVISGALSVDELRLANAHNITLVFHTFHAINLLQKYSGYLSLRAWIKVDTGLGRIGFLEHEFKDAYLALKSDPRILSIGIITQLAGVGSNTAELDMPQIEKFNKLISFTKDDRCIQYSICNSAGIVLYPFAHYDFIRPGVAMYGCSPIRGRLPSEFNLKPVMTLCSRVLAVKNLKAGNKIGYGGAVTLEKDTQIAIIGCGYGDGYPAWLEKKIPAFIHDVQCNILGEVSMDTIAVDATSLNVNVGDVVKFWGDFIPLESHGLRSAPIVTGISKRVKRIWM